MAVAQLQAAPIVEQIAPGSKSCDAANKECRTAEQAAPFLAQGMTRYGIYNVNEMAAVLSLMAFESVDFKYKTNQVPGRPGQGTANMQMAAYNLKYAKSIDRIKEKVADINSVEGLSDEELNNIRSLVLPDEYNFASGQWFLTTQCDQSIRKQLQEDVDKGFAAYMGCVGVQVNSERTAYLDRAKKAFGIN
jgi:cobyrinic acid a,c-diamide synthase